MRPRSIAFYLPQFHPIPENDRWWGNGFTEWTNVRKAEPRFAGHHQPHVPSEIGYYDLRDPDVRNTQAQLAVDHGVDAFCYYHYWFGGRRLLERPFAEVVATGEPDHPFCLCWANEDWTRTWAGAGGETLMGQEYSAEDDRNHIRSLLEPFADPRYVRVEGRPLFLVYRASRLPEPRRTTDIWREEASRSGLGDLFLCRVESFRSEHSDPRDLGFDAAVEFQPDWTIVRPPTWRHVVSRLAGGKRAPGRPEYTAFDYSTLVDRALARPRPAYRQFRCVTPSWDNTARRDRGAVVLTGSTPDEYGRWLEAVASQAADAGDADGLVFVNAWNEWGEGCHLEPDERWGRGYLEAHRQAMQSLDDDRARWIP